MNIDSPIKYEMTQENYIDHELRIRMAETVNKQLINRINALITIAITAVIIPCLFKYFGV